MVAMAWEKRSYKFGGESGCWMLDGKDLTELMACYIQFNLGTADVALL